jgi:hypothetical protein
MGSPRSTSGEVTEDEQDDRSGRWSVVPQRRHARIRVRGGGRRRGVARAAGQVVWNED